jgi:hypothetical protein
MRRSVLAVVALALVGVVMSVFAGTGQAVQQGPSTSLSNGITFEHSTIVDPFRVIGEPDIAIDNKGGIYSSGPGGTPTQHSFFWKSDDGGYQWHGVGVIPEFKGNGQNGGGDTEIAIDKNNNVYTSDLQTLTCNSVMVSNDEGKTFKTSEGCAPGTDRQWMGTYTDAQNVTHTYLSANGQVVGCYMLGSTNGLVYTPTGNTTNQGEINGDGCIGKFAIDQRNGTIYVPMSGGSIVKSTDGGATWQEVGDSGAQGNFFANIAIDTAGNLYQGWTDTKKAYLSVSTDGGADWTQYQLNTPDIKQELFPWTVVGDPGRVAVVFYGTTDKGSGGGFPGSVSAVWHAYSVLSTDALAGSPRFQQVQVDEHVMHKGPICTGGFPGCLLSNADRSLADFFEVGMDPRDGRVFVVYNDNADISPVSKIGKAYVVVARERTGPSLLADHPDFTTATADAAIGSAQVTGSSVAVAGTHGLPAGNWATDVAGDAAWPVVPVTGPNNAALDIREASVAEAAGNLTFKMNLADLSDTARAQSPESLGVPAYVFTWWWKDAHYFVRWHDGANVAEYGQVGAIDWPALGAPAPKFLTYVPSGTATAAVTGNSLAITVPSANVGAPQAGAKLDNITAYTWSEKGPVPSVVDQARAFSYVMGTAADAQHAPDGYVQISVDDPTFASPLLATLTGANGWSATLGPLGTGTHTIYVRQVLSAVLYNPGLWDDVTAGPVTSTTITI